ncbi:hypothetical protein GY21_12275 [Cryobacterium roopkundense]|uniref:Cardiolipin synthase N-terminal domain-containing protein n=1 Tax=Cryobacterium roopkundense TaxID=1001240 RepID=A0A099J5U3_9MICO|nr:PLD nuclease N-terminal domain-containing protein [Cryobacterium roopkundense]KGJ72882.1 hypothetical protein GY21_12275 [Cryobacterium roopkundense]MBB5643482.1 hypothetical protein [Cryobacterium roopkundense]
MPKLLIFIGLAVLILTVYTVVDCALFERKRVRGLPRWVWIFVIVLVPLIGPLLWLFVGRGRGASPVGRSFRTVAPDDDPEFLRSLNNDKDTRERLRRLEEELADLDKPEAKKDQDVPKTTDPGEGDQPGRRDV